MSISKRLQHAHAGKADFLSHVKFIHNKKLEIKSLLGKTQTPKQFTNSFQTMGQCSQHITGTLTVSDSGIALTLRFKQVNSKVESMALLLNKNIHAPLEEFSFVHLHFAYMSMSKLK